MSGAFSDLYCETLGGRKYRRGSLFDLRHGPYGLFGYQPSEGSVCRFFEGFLIPGVPHNKQATRELQAGFNSHFVIPEEYFDEARKAVNTDMITDVEEAQEVLIRFGAKRAKIGVPIEWALFEPVNVQ